MNVPTKLPGFLVVLTLLLVAQRSSAEADAECKWHRGSANWTGTSASIAVPTNAYFCVSDGTKCSSKGGQLFIKNNSKKEYGLLNSTAAGLHNHPINPGDQEYHTLAVYRDPKAGALKVDLELYWCVPRRRK